MLCVYICTHIAYIHKLCVVSIENTDQPMNGAEEKEGEINVCDGARCGLARSWMNLRQMPFKGCTIDA